MTDYISIHIAFRWKSDIGAKLPMAEIRIYFYFVDRKSVALSSSFENRSILNVTSILVHVDINIIVVVANTCNDTTMISA